jgi:hypothetical protein
MLDISYMFTYNYLKVKVVSGDGWCWALAWRQLGIAIVNCYALSGLA